MNQEEYKEIFLAEAQESFEELNKLFTVLEKNHEDKSAVEAIFRILHTLKGNAAAMGFDSIASLTHILEDIFSEIKEGNMMLTTQIFDTLFKAIDKLGDMLEGEKEGKKVPYKGMRTKLRVILRKVRGEEETQSTKAKEEPKDEPPKQPQEESTEALKEEETIKEETTQQTVTEKEETAKEKSTEPINQETPPQESNGKEETSSEEPSTDDSSLIEEPISETPVQEEKKASNISFSDYVQVPVSKLDDLLNLVGELAIEKDRIIAQNAGMSNASEFARLYRITSDLQYSVMGVRLVQVNVLFHKFHRIIRDVSVMEGKKVNLNIEGGDIEIDRNVLQIISDSMIHLVRNAVSHGIESKERRTAAHKDTTGNITLRAKNDKEYVVIEVEDDGKGIDATMIRKKVIEKGLAKPEFINSLPDEEAVKFIFEPGFSSVEQVTSVSGRGVGMDVVKKAVDSIGGKINIKTKIGQGSVMSMSLPSSMAVKSTLLFMLKDAEFAIPLSYTEAVISLKAKEIFRVGNGLMSTYQEHNISVLFMNDIFGCEHVSELYQPKLLHRGLDQCEPDDKLDIIVVTVDDRLVGLVVDKLLQQKEIIEKPLVKPVESVPFISGATILGNGHVCLVLDIPSIIDYLFKPTFSNANVIE